MCELSSQRKLRATQEGDRVPSLVNFYEDMQGSSISDFPKVRAPRQKQEKGRWLVKAIFELSSNLEVLEFINLTKQVPKLLEMHEYGQSSKGLREDQIK